MKKAFRVLVVIIFLSFSLAIAFSIYANGVIREAKGQPVINFVSNEGENPYLIKTYADGSPCYEDFKIITFADPHLNGRDEIPGDGTALTVIENSIKYEKPDLVVICGDIVIGELAEQAAQTLGQLFERYNQYWGYALGNHDAENPLGPERAELVSIFSEFEHCIISSYPNISGEGNCIVNVKNTKGKVLQSLVFIDSGNYLTPEICLEYGFDYREDDKYDFIKYDQIEWYKDQMQDIAQKNKSMPDSIMFIHIPLKEYRIGYNEAKQDDAIIYGSRRERECDSPYNTGMFDAILEVGSTKAVVCGHDHVNDYCVDYKGVKLLYSLSVSFNSYFLRNNPIIVAAYNLDKKSQFNDGYTLFSVDRNGEQTITPKYNQYNPSLFDGLTEEQREALFLDITLSS